MPLQSSIASVALCISSAIVTVIKKRKCCCNMLDKCEQDIHVSQMSFIAHKVLSKF